MPHSPKPLVTKRETEKESDYFLFNSIHPPNYATDSRCVVDSISFHQYLGPSNQYPGPREATLGIMGKYIARFHQELEL